MKPACNKLSLASNQKNLRVQCAREELYYVTLKREFFIVFNDVRVEDTANGVLTNPLCLISFPFFKIEGKLIWTHSLITNNPLYPINQATRQFGLSWRGIAYGNITHHPALWNLLYGVCLATCLWKSRAKHTNKTDISPFIHGTSAHLWIQPYRHAMHKPDKHSYEGDHLSRYRFLLPLFPILRHEAIAITPGSKVILTA